MNLKSIILILGTFILFNPATKSQIWQEVGPTHFPLLSGFLHGTGRVEQFKFHSTISNKMYAATLHGGLFSSSDNGNTWNTLGTDQLSACSLTSFCVDPIDEGTIYISTCDELIWNANTVIYKTTNGGSTWNNVNGPLVNTLASSMLIDSSNTQRIVIATNNGIWRSTNGALSWTNVKPGGNFRHMMQVPGTNILLAVTATEVWRSTDFGINWTQNNSVSFAEPNSDGMRVCVNNASPNIVYVMSNGGYGTVFKSLDAGITFAKIYSSTAVCIVCLSPTSTTGQGDYDFAACCDPGNPNHLYIAAHCIWESNDGGFSWEQKTSYSVPIHTDHTQLAFDPFDSSALWISNDGGMFKRIGLNDSTWEMKCNGLSSLEIYHGSCSPNKKELLSVGTQDNGQLLKDSLGWYNLFGGDQTNLSIFDYTNSNNLCFPWAGTRLSCTPSGGIVSFNSQLPLSNKNRMAFSKFNPDLALHSRSEVWMSRNFSSISPTWSLIRSSPTSISEITLSSADPEIAFQLTDSAIFRMTNLSSVPIVSRFANPARPTYAGAICTIKNNVNVLYASFSEKIFRSIDQGANWTNITYNLPASDIKQILSDDYSTNETIYLLSGDAYSDTRIFKKTITDTIWQDISGNLPRVTYITDLMMYNDSSEDSKLYASLFGRGVWSYKMNDSLSTTIQNNYKDNLSIKLFPNPASTFVNIENPELKSYIVSFFNSEGKLILERKSDSSILQVDTKAFAAGPNYYIVISGARTKRGTLVIVK